MPALSAATISERLAPLLAAPERAAVLLDVDGTLAPIVDRPEHAEVPERTGGLLEQLGGRYAAVACVSGRSAADARRLVGVDSILYAGTHGGELLEPGHRESHFLPALEQFRGQVSEYAAGLDDGELRRLGVRIEDKGSIVAFHWRGATDEAQARAELGRLAGTAEADGLTTHWGRKVLEVRPPVPLSKGRAVREVVERADASGALFAGDDTTDLDGFEALDELVGEGALEAAVRVGVRSEEGPAAIVERADLAVDGPPGVVAVLEALLER